MLPHAAGLLRLGACCLIGLASVFPRQASAQEGTLRGTVTDSTGAPIAAADVGIAALHRLTKTDDRGRFSFDKMPLGPVDVSVRRLGYTPQTVKATVSNTLEFSFSVTLAAQAAVLAGVDVSEKRRRIGIEDFHKRRIRGVGAFITREDILARHASVPTDVLRSTPGLQIVRTRTGQGIRFSSASTGRRDCIPMMWIDGQRAPGMEIDELPVTDIEGIELYRGASTTPPQFWQGNTPSCGTIVVWSRNPGN